ncbi:MAG: hypothetical protein HRT70_01340 [Flavobacteriaceae bacterium]|nr:hypothetical protein [Flavobacteriaceae bacterium]
MDEENDLLNTNVIMRILTETEKSEDKDRRIQAFDAYQCYSGNQAPYVRQQIERNRPTSAKGYTISNISISKMITDKRAQAYSEEPIRKVSDSDDKTELYDEILKEGSGNEELEFFDKTFNLHKYGLMWVNYRQKEQMYQFMSLQPYEFILVRDKDTGKLLIVGLNYPDTEITQNSRTGANRDPGMKSNTSDGIADLVAEGQTDGAAESKTWVFWSDTQVVKVVRRTTTVIQNGVEVLKPSITYIPIEGNPDNVNPLGTLPFVYVSSDTSVDYPTINPLTEQSITFNAQQSETLTAKNVHGSGVQVFKYPERMAGRFQKMSHGQLSAIELPQSSKEGDSTTEFDYKTSGAQIGPMMDSDTGYLTQIMKEHGIENFEMDSGVNAMNGISRAISGASVQKIIEHNQKRYHRLEKAMFKIVARWEQVIGSRRISEDDELMIIFPKPKVMVSDRETLENIKMMLELGLIEEHEKFIKMDPNMTEEEAKEKLERIEAKKMENAQRFLGGFNDNQSERVDQEGEPESEGFIGGTEAEG